MPSGNTERCYWGPRDKAQNFVVEQNVFERIYDNLNRLFLETWQQFFEVNGKQKLF